jgi:hypothetical protein
MGSVYLARSDRGRTVAVKLVRRELAEQEEFRARFRREVQAARRVGGYWTAPVLDADTEADIPWVATGYVAGPTLQTVVSQDHGALPERSVRVLAAGLAHALQDIHAAGLIHRDLKPSNVLVTIDGPRVIDFGIARALETLAGAGFTRTGALVGSPGFMAPEQVRGDRVTPACDVFCLGSVLAYAATGTLPFGGADSGVHALMFRIAQEDPDLEDLPEGLAELVGDCLHKDPAARPTPAQILERTGADDTLSEGRSRDPWLPGALVAQLGRHAVRLLDAEDPEDPEAGGGAEGPEGPEDSKGSQGARGPEGAGAGAPGAADAPTAPAPLPAPTVPGPPPASGAPYGAVPPPPGVFGPPPQHSRPPAPGGWGTPPYGPSAYGDPPPARRSGRFTALLILVALVVALGAGGSVYAVLRGDGTGTTGGGTPSRTSAAPTTPGPSTPGQPSPSASASGSVSAGTGSTGAVPDAYLGTWTAAIDNATGHNTRRLVVQQGGVGDTVLSLTADGGTYHCVFRAELAEKPAANGPLRIGPSAVSGGRPASSCTPGGASELTLLPDGRLKRVNTTTGEALTYTKTG